MLVLLRERETYAPCSLVRKATLVVLLRPRTGNGGIHARAQQVEINMGDHVRQVLDAAAGNARHIPTLLLLSLHKSFSCGLVYCLLEACPLVFEGVHGMRPRVSGLPFQDAPWDLS
jgi:DHA1 family multidrug resistance protein-like MFS transporter